MEQNNLTVKEQFDLATMPKEMDKDIAWNVAQMIEDAESDVRLAKGKFWSRCEHGTREEICDHFGWKYESMKKYSMYANELPEIGPIGPISYTQWRKAKDAKMLKPVRVELFKRAADEGWTPEQIDAAIPKPTPAVKPVKSTNVTKEDMDNAREKINSGEYTVPPGNQQGSMKASAGLSISEAFAVFGIHGGRKISQESLKVLYGYYSKKTHPDSGGSTELFQKINEANQILQKEIV